MNIKFLFKDETQINERKKGYAYPVDVPKCARLTDEESGLIVISTKGMSQLENKQAAMQVLNSYKCIEQIKNTIKSHAESCTLSGNCLDERLCLTCFLGGAKKLGEEILDIIKEYERGEIINGI